jgi:uncharacterized protein YcbK (DUF882 family)
MTKNFKLKEFFVSKEYPDMARWLYDNHEWYVRNNLYLLARFIMQEVRDYMGEPIKILSGYRSEELNSLVGGSKRSRHMDGLACDFTCSDLKKAFDFIQTMDFGELILYENFIHVSLPKYGCNRLIKEM